MLTVYIFLHDLKKEVKYGPIILMVIDYIYMPTYVRFYFRNFTSSNKQYLLIRPVFINAPITITLENDFMCYSIM